jgi:hypothetical protein
LPIIWSAKEEEEVELCSVESVNVLILPRKIPLVSGRYRGGQRNKDKAVMLLGGEFL